MVSYMFYLVCKHFMDGVCAVLGVFGIVSNILNFLLYKSFIKDTLAPTYMLVALIDVSMCVLTLLLWICNLIQSFVAFADFDLLSFSNVLFYSWRELLKCMSVLLILHIIVSTSLCVISPVKIDARLAKRRLLFGNIFIIVFSLACFVPVWITQRLQWTFVSSSNLTYLQQCNNASNEEIELWLLVFVEILIPLAAQIFCVGNIVAISLVLKKSAKFQQYRSNSKVTGKYSTSLADTPNKQVLPTKDKNSAAVLRAIVLPYRYVKLANIVALINISCWLTILPSLVLRLAGLFLPESATIEAYSAMDYFYCNLAEACILIWASVKIFPYYYVNPKFRRTLLTLISRKRYLNTKAT